MIGRDLRKDIITDKPTKVAIGQQFFKVIWDTDFGTVSSAMFAPEIGRAHV